MRDGHARTCLSALNDRRLLAPAGSAVGGSGSSLVGKARSRCPLRGLPIPSPATLVRKGVSRVRRQTAPHRVSSAGFATPEVRRKRAQSWPGCAPAWHCGLRLFSGMRRGFRKVAGLAELDAARWTPRELRHSFVSLLSDGGMPIEQISLLVGHSGTTVTELVYRKQIRPVIQDGATVMDTLVGVAGFEPTASSSRIGTVGPSTCDMGGKCRSGHWLRLVCTGLGAPTFKIVSQLSPRRGARRSTDRQWPATTTATSLRPTGLAAAGARGGGRAGKFARVGLLDDVVERDGGRCWTCDEPVDPDMSVNDPRGLSVDSRTADRKAKVAERLAHRAGATPARGRSRWSSPGRTTCTWSNPPR